MNYILEFPESALLYIAVVFLTTLTGKFATKTNVRLLRWIGITTIILIFSLVSGLRAYEVGNDTSNYATHIINWQSNPNYIRYPTEPGMKILSNFMAIFAKGPTPVLLLIAFIINTLIIIRLWSYRKIVQFEIGVFFYSIIYYTITFSGIRQMLAVAVVFWASKYLIDRKHKKYLFCVFVAILFHNSAIIALIIPIIDLIDVQKKYKKSALLSAVILIPILIITSLVFIELTFGIFDRYSGYVQNISFQTGTSITVWIRIFLVIAIYIFVNKSMFENIKDFELFKRMYSILFIGLIFVIPGYFINNLNRISLYLLIHEVLVYSVLYRNKKGLISIIIYAILMFYFALFILELMYSGLNHMPYIPYWESKMLY